MSGRVVFSLTELQAEILLRWFPDGVINHPYGDARAERALCKLEEKRLIRQGRIRRVLTPSGHAAKLLLERLAEFERVSDGS